MCGLTCARILQAQVTATFHDKQGRPDEAEASRTEAQKFRLLASEAANAMAAHAKNIASHRAKLDRIEKQLERSGREGALRSRGEAHRGARAAAIRDKDALLSQQGADRSTMRELCARIAREQSDVNAIGAEVESLAGQVRP